MLTNVKYWLWLTDALPPQQAWQVFTHFGSPEKAYFADPEEFRQVEGLSPDQIELLRRAHIRPAEDILARCDCGGIRILTFQDTDFPERLRNTEIPPLVLYLRGRMLRFDERAVIAMVGTRKATAYGQQLSFRFGRELCAGGAIVATGPVTGCDAQAAKGALHGGGPLALVMAGGVDVPYYGNESGAALLSDAAANGCVLSESPPGTGHEAHRFRRRNAILAGLSNGVLCVEGSSRSGAVHVAQLASEMGKDVYAVPGSIGAPASEGTNDLLRSQIALPVIAAGDILSRYSYLLPRPALEVQPTVLPRSARRSSARQTRPAAAPQPSPAPQAEKKVDTVSNSGYIELLNSDPRWNPQERSLLAVLAKGSATVESLIASSGLSASVANATLVMLAVGGTIEECGGGRYRICPKALEKREE